MATHCHHGRSTSVGLSVGQSVGLAEARKRFGGPDLPAMVESR